MPGLLEESSSQQENHTKASASSQNLPKGVVLDKDGKPCRTCTSSAAWMSMMKQSTSKTSSSSSSSSTISKSALPFSAASFAAAASTTTTPTSHPDTTSSSSSSQTDSPETNDCPPDVEELGRSSWTLLHSLTATYPTNPTPQMKSTVSQFLSLFSQLYPCWVCADDFRGWMRTPGNEPALNSQDEFGRWMCRAHNAVNVKLGKEEFDCDLWRERWRDGWSDGRCG